MSPTGSTGGFGQLSEGRLLELLADVAEESPCLRVVCVGGCHHVGDVYSVVQIPSFILPEPTFHALLEPATSALSWADLWRPRLLKPSKAALRSFNRVEWALL